MNTSVPQSEEEKGRGEEEGGEGQTGLRTAVKEETQGKRRLAEQESPPSLGYDWFFPCARTTTKKIIKKIQNGALKTKMREEEGGLLAGMWCWLLCCCFSFLFFCSIKPR